MADATTTPPVGNPAAVGMRGAISFNFNAPQPPEDKAALQTSEQRVFDNLGNILSGRFQVWSDARRPIEEGWLKDLRQYNGIYEPSIEAKLEDRSKAFLKMTRMKTLSVFSRIVDLLLGHDRNWSLSNTPIPELDPLREAELKAEILRAPPRPGQIDNSQISPEDMQELLLETERDLAKIAADLMQTQIDDQLVEEKYDSLLKTTIMEICLLGTGCIKGPVVKTKIQNRWARDEKGDFALIQKRKTVPGLTAPTIFDTYPDPYCIEVEDGIGLFERHVMTSGHLRGLGDYPGFNLPAIEEVITHYPNGNHTDLHHEIERRNIANNMAFHVVDQRFDVIEYWGQVKGSELAASGITVHPDKLGMDIQANVWFCGQRTLKAQLNPLTPERIPYQFARYEKVPHNFWGNGVPRQMNDSQDGINSAMRTIMDNEAYSSGPQIEVNKSLLAPGEDPRDLRPFKIWVREGGDSSTPLLRFYHIENHTEALMKIVEMFRKFMDEETNQPSYTHGDEIPGLNKTASGMSMLFGAANMSTKGVIKNIDDDLTAPTIRGMYDWNMRWNPRKDIKCDADVDAKGSTALLAKEMQSQRLLQYLNLTNNPVDLKLIGAEKRANALREVAIAMDLNPDEVAPDADQFKGDVGAGAQPPGGGGGDGAVGPPGMGGAQAVPQQALAA